MRGKQSARNLKSSSGLHSDKSGEFESGGVDGNSISDAVGGSNGELARTSLEEVVGSSNLSWEAGSSNFSWLVGFIRSSVVSIVSLLVDGQQSHGGWLTS